MGFPLGSFTLIQFSPPSAEGETEEKRHGRGGVRGREKQRRAGRGQRGQRREGSKKRGKRRLVRKQCGEK